MKRFEDAKIEVYEEGKSEVLKRTYFTQAGVERDVRHQGYPNVGIATAKI